MDKRTVSLAAILLLLCACSSQPSPQEREETTERDAMTPLKQHYPDVVWVSTFMGPSQMYPSILMR